MEVAVRPAASFLLEPEVMEDTWLHQVDDRPSYSFPTEELCRFYGGQSASRHSERAILGRFVASFVVLGQEGRMHSLSHGMIQKLHALSANACPCPAWYPLE